MPKKRAGAGIREAVKGLVFSLILLAALIGAAVMAFLSGNGQPDKPAPSPAPPAASANIRLAAPSAGALVSSPLTAEGEARVFENQFSYRIRDAYGNVVSFGSAYAASPDAGIFGPFNIFASYPSPSTASGTFEAYDNSPKDGKEIDKAIVPIEFLDYGRDALKIYFGNKNRAEGDCSQVYPLYRNLPHTAAPARESLEALLAGPSPAEQAAGYFSSISPGVKINRLSIVDGTAYADFDSSIEKNAGGSCRMAAIRQQILQTLLQFRTVRQAVISVNGRVEEALQP